MNKTEASVAPGARKAEARRLALFLAIGDAVALLVFSALGRGEHALGVTMLGTLRTAWPFLLGWALVAPFTGAWRPTAEGRPPPLRRALVTWLAAWPVGLGIRAAALGRGIPLSFAVVTFGIVLALLVVWRCAFAWLARRAT